MKRMLSLISSSLFICLLLLSINTNAQSRKHVVKAGETFYHIATEYGVKVADLQQANPAVVKSGLKPGQALVIPDGGKAPATKTDVVVETPPVKKEKVTTIKTTTTTTKTAEPAATKTTKTTTITTTTTSAADEPIPTRGYHVVKAKETIASICKDFGITETDLKKWNDLSGGLKPGMSLKVVEL